MRTSLAGWVLSVSAILVFSPILSPALQGQTTRNAPASKPGGTPGDLTGLWLRPKVSPHIDQARRFDAQQPPMTAWAEAKFKATQNMYKQATGKAVLDRLSGGDPTYSCFPPGVPGIYFRVTGDARPMEIIPAKDRILELFEYDHFVRQIWTDGREHPQDLAATWMGDSIGNWKGDTLVVDSIGFNDKTVLDGAGHPHSEDLHLVERIRRLDKNTLEVNLTITDPKAYKQPWGGQLIFVSAPPDWNIMEDICEDNANFIDFIKKANADPQQSK
jgi:hypothetical protein